MRNRLRGVALAVGPLLLASTAWLAIEALGGTEPEVIVHEEPATPRERAEFREAVRHWTETGKWPCPESGLPPKPPERPEGEVDTLEHRFGPEDYDCPTRNSGR